MNSMSSCRVCPVACGRWCVCPGDAANAANLDVQVSLMDVSNWLLVLCLQRARGWLCGARRWRCCRRSRFTAVPAPPGTGSPALAAPPQVKLWCCHRACALRLLSCPSAPLQRSLGAPAVILVRCKRSPAAVLRALLILCISPATCRRAHPRQRPGAHPGAWLRSCGGGDVRRGVPHSIHSRCSRTALDDRQGSSSCGSHS